MLKSLEISGFKSFAKKTELNFKSQVTAIVGPNGSGKSNVAESFRFVLGEQSMKSMRGKRGEDMIWNGSNEVSRSNRATVKLTFDNSRNLFKISEDIKGGDFEEIIIERVVNRDGGNEYYLNGSQVRLKDVMSILSQAHIGSSGHHIISQGEADRILSANTRERREMIEDALGLKVYQYKREESERKLLKTEENIKQVESLRREIAPHIKFLKKQVEKVEKAEELRQKLSKFYRQYLKIEKTYLESEKSKIESEKKPLSERLHHLEKEMEKAKEILEKSNKKDGKSEEIIEIESKIRAERENKDKLWREIGKIEGEIGASHRQIEKMRFDLRSLENKTILLKEVEDLEKEISTYSEINKIIQKIRDFINKHKALPSGFGQEKNLTELEEEKLKLEKNKTKLEEEILKIDKKLLELDFEYSEIKNSIEKEKDTERDAEKNIFRISSEQSEFRNRLELIKEREHRLSIEENDFKRELQEGGVLLGSAILGFENEILDEELQESSQKKVWPSEARRPEDFLEGSFLAISQNQAKSDNFFAEQYRENLRKELERMKIRLEELGGGGGAEVTKEYKDTVERDEFLQKELEDLKISANSLELLIKDLIEKLDVEFKNGIEKINKSFQEYFSVMFDGGNAELKIEKFKTQVRKLESLEEELVPRSSEELQSEVGEKTEEGIEISVSLPRKRIKSLEMLSGGERALTSIALLFAISQVNPPPFIILDETDAALDEANSKKYGDMIENLSKVSQLILITHNRETMSRAGVIYGVTMGRDGVSRLLSIAFDEAVVVAK